MHSPKREASASSAKPPTTATIPRSFSQSRHGVFYHRQRRLSREFDRHRIPKGLRTLDFTLQSFRILKGKPRLFGGLVESYGDHEQCTTLEITLREKLLPLRILLTYTTFEDTDVITRRTTLHNDGQESVVIRNLASAQVDLEGSWELVTFDGAWGRERYVNRRELKPGIYINDSKKGVSSADHNPAIFLTNEENECVGFNLVYSGNHRELVEVSPFGKTRVMTGINPTGSRGLRTTSTNSSITTSSADRGSSASGRSSSTTGKPPTSTSPKTRF